MIQLLAPQRGRLRWFYALASLTVACNVYEHGLVASGSALDGSGGKDNAGAAANGAAPSGGDNASSGKAAATANGAAAGNATSAGSSQGGTTATASGGQTSAAAGSATMTEATAGAGGSDGDTQPQLELLDDMEDGDAFVTNTKGRNGHWDVSNDATVGASQSPTPAAFAMAELLDPTRPDSHFAAYTKGNGFKDWGAFMTVSMRTWPDYDQTPVYDASGYSGIMFFAKAGVGSDTSLRVRYIGAQTDARGGQCTPGGAIDVACYDHFYADVKLTQQWQRFELLFADFHQAGVGKMFPAIDLSRMYALEFFFPGRSTVTGNAFELWVDDLSFIVK